MRRYKIANHPHGLHKHETVASVKMYSVNSAGYLNSNEEADLSVEMMCMKDYQNEAEEDGKTLKARNSTWII